MSREPNDPNVYGEEAVMDGPEYIIAQGKSDNPEKKTIVYED
jgi:hypothetical protein